MKRSALRTGVIIALAAIALAACGGAKRFDYQATADEMKPGPGLFSGTGGTFVIVGEIGPGARAGQKPLFIRPSLRYFRARPMSSRLMSAR